MKHCAWMNADPLMISSRIRVHPDSGRLEEGGDGLERVSLAQVHIDQPARDRFG